MPIMTCRVKLSLDRCRICVDMETTYGVYIKCEECSALAERYDILSFVVDFLGVEKAVLLTKNGTIETVPVSRIFDIQYKNKNQKEDSNHAVQEEV